MSAHPYRRSQGFTLIELIVTITILGILSAIAVYNLPSLLDRAKLTIDHYNLKILNTVTPTYLSEMPSENPFTDSTATNQERLVELVSQDYLDAVIVIQTQDTSFTWNLTDVRWEINSQKILSAAEVVFGTGWRSNFITSYTGSFQDILIPVRVDGTIITQIYQDAFKGKSLSSIEFDADSQIARIHARAFQNNNLTAVTLPPSLTRIDYGAFMGNSITSISIGENVYLEDKAIENNNNFRTVYLAQGAGTYTLSGGVWSKE